jgi:hypothetical protein
MRQYQIFYKRAGGKNFGRLQPGVHANLYEKPEIAAAIEHIRTTPHVEGMSLRLGTEMFNVFSFDQPAEAPNSFKFDEPQTVAEVVASLGDGTAAASA